MSSSDDDVPLSKRRRTARMVKNEEEEEEEEGEQASSVGESEVEASGDRAAAAASSDSSSGNEDDDDDSDEDKPLVSRSPSTATRRQSSSAARRSGSRPKAKAKPKARASPKQRTSVGGSRQSAGRVKRESQSPKVTAKRRTATPKAKSRARTVGRVKRAKEEDGSEEGGEFERGDARKYFKEGQTKICPPMGDCCRAFYETLLQENPHSLIAIKWCIERGCLMGSQQKEVLAKFYSLKEKGAYKLAPGGIKPGLSDKHLDEATKKKLEDSMEDHKPLKSSRRAR